MKFFIFTCLLAVAFAKQEDICSTTSCEETTKSIKEMEYSSSSSSEESAAITTEDKINQFYQKMNLLQFLQALYQNQIAMNQWDQIKTTFYPFITTLNKEQLSASEESNISQKENSQKAVDMESTEVFTEKTEVTEEKKDDFEILNKINQYYHKFIFPQYLKTVPQYQVPMSPWNHIKPNPYQFVPTMNYF